MIDPGHPIQAPLVTNGDEPADRPKKPAFRIRVVLVAVLIGWLIMDVFSTAGLTSAILFGGQTRSRELARRAACMSNVKSLAQLLRTYAASNSLEGKTLADLSTELPDLQSDPRLMQCPTNPSAQYLIDAAGLTSSDYPLIFELPGTHPAIKSWSIFGRSLPAAHCECRIIGGKITAQFVSEE